jgi:hypothetical protein
VTDSLHPAQLALLRFFDCSHLPPQLQATVRPFAALAWDTARAGVTSPYPAEVTTALRKLLEAKDAAVRSACPALEPTPPS